MHNIPDPVVPDERIERALFSRMSGYSSGLPHVRVVETRSLHPWYLIPLAALTSLFVATALAFTARLFDAIDSPISGRQLLTLIAWTWGLAGTSLTLLVWDYIVLPRAFRLEHTLRKAAPSLVVAATICFETAYLFGPQFIDGFVARTTGAERECAAQLRVLATARQAGSPGAAREHLQSLLMAAPIVGLTCNGIGAVSSDGLKAALRGLAVRRLGTADQVYNGVFIPSVRSLRDAYNEYAAAQVRLVTEIDAIPGQLARAWQQFQARLEQKGLVPGHIPRRDWPQLAAGVRATGVPVPADWNPTDRGTFVAVLASMLRHAADAAYARTVTEHLRQSFPPGLGWKEFYSEPTIQARWRTMIDAPPVVMLSPDMGFPAFRDTVYEPRLNATVQAPLSELASPAAAFASHGRLAAAGLASVAWAMIPAILLHITILLMLLHAARLIHFGALLLIPSARVSTRAAVTACACFIVIFALTWSLLLPGHVIQAADGIRGATACAESRSRCNVVSRLPLLWTLGSDLRNTAFAGFDFGYDAVLATEQSEALLLLPPAPTKFTP